MPALESPFVTKPITCPVCGQATEQRFFRQRLFVPEGMESDQHVLSYKWLARGVAPDIITHLKKSGSMAAQKA